MGMNDALADASVSEVRAVPLLHSMERKKSSLRWSNDNGVHPWKHERHKTYIPGTVFL
jgi:hypothetical protein